MNAQEKMQAVLNTRQICGACGEYIPKGEREENGLFHSAKFCSVAIEEELNKEESN